jgi:hypothetical protein
MSTLTVYLARLMGLSVLVFVVAFMVRGNAMIMATVSDSPVMLVYAIFSVAAGLAIILGHNVWSGGALPVIVSLAGWLIFAKGLMLLFVNHETLSLLLERMHYSENYIFYFAPSLLLGLYLTYAGFTAQTSKL